MVDENAVDREVGLEVIRRGLATRDTLLAYVQERRQDPSRPFTTVLVSHGVLTPQLADELDRLARERAGANDSLSTQLDYAFTRPPPGKEPSSGFIARGRKLPPPPPPPPPVTDRTPSGRIPRGDRTPSGAVPGVGDRTPSGRVKSGSHISIDMPQHTVMDLGMDVPSPEVASDPQPVAESPVPQAGRTMLEEPLEMPPAEEGAGRTMLEAIEVPGDQTEPELNPPPKAPPRPQKLTGRRAVAEPSPVLVPGKYFGDYEVVSTLGEGAMGQVFRARRRSDGLEVALKVVRGGIVASAKVRERFLREAKAAKLIDHPNVVKFIDAGMIASDQFLAMEFVEGRSLQSVLGESKGKPLPLARAFELFRQICSGLTAAHEAGVIHRDLKPENILIAHEGEVVKITDFGLARREEESMLLTRPGQIMGSPYYMAPEQGQGLPVDARADLYSLGTILFCLMTGRVPFPFPSATEVIHAHCEAERPDPRSVNPEISEELAAFMLRLLAIDPDQRPQTARAALQEFDAVAAHTSVIEPPAEVPPDDASDEVEIYTGPEIVDALPAGTRVGRLTIQGVLGAGGMGAVYYAKHDEGRVSALKVLPPKFATDAKRLKSFLREGELGKRIHSPNVVETRDYGSDPATGMAYIEQELVQGTSVDNLIKTGVLQQEALVINILRGVAQGLSALHSAGIIHRDVKPSNILLSGEFLSRADGGVKLIDLGLAIEKAQIKKSGDDEMAGTPTYMAPEQTLKDGLVDERSDLYSLGCAIYHLATGNVPFEGKTPAAIAYQHQRTSVVSAKTRNPLLTDGFSAILDLLMAKSPDERYVSAEALVADLAKTDEEGKLKRPEIHAKYRTNRLGKAGDKFGAADREKEKAPNRKAVIAAAAVFLVCLLIMVVQLARSGPKKSPEPPPPPPPPKQVPTPAPGGGGSEDGGGGATDGGGGPSVRDSEKRRKREKEVKDLNEIAARQDPNTDWRDVRKRLQAVKAEDPNASVDKVDKQLEDVVKTFEAALADAVSAAKRVKDSKKETDRAMADKDCDQQIAIARQCVSRDGDDDRLAKMLTEVEGLRH
jgi:serine/threonine protein kinase